MYYLSDRTSTTLLTMPFSSRVGNSIATVLWAADPVDSHIRIQTWTQRRSVRGKAGWMYTKIYKRYLPCWAFSVLDLQLFSQTPERFIHLVFYIYSTDIKYVVWNICVLLSPFTVKTIHHPVVSGVALTNELDITPQHSFRFSSHLDVIKNSEQCLPHFSKMLNEVISLAASD